MKKVVINYSELSKKGKIFYWLRKVTMGIFYVAILVVLTVTCVYSLLHNSSDDESSFLSASADTNAVYNLPDYFDFFIYIQNGTTDDYLILEYVIPSSYFIRNVEYSNGVYYHYYYSDNLTTYVSNGGDLFDVVSVSVYDSNCFYGDSTHDYTAAGFSLLNDVFDFYGQFSSSNYYLYNISATYGDSLGTSLYYYLGTSDGSSYTIYSAFLMFSFDRLSSSLYCPYFSFRIQSDCELFYLYNDSDYDYLVFDCGYLDMDDYYFGQGLGFLNALSLVGETDDYYYQGYDDGYSAGYSAGVDVGYNIGYGAGYEDGEAVGVDVGYGVGYDAGYEDGEAVGVDVGYGIGYDAGYEDGEAVGVDVGYGVGYDAGYEVGYWYGQADGYDIGYSFGYDEGYTDGYGVGYTDGNVDGVESGYAAGEVSGYNSGYEAGVNDNTYYSVGYEDGYDVGYSTAYDYAFDLGVNELWSNPVSALLSGVADILDINIFGYFSLGTFLQIFLYIFVVLMFLRMFAG